MSENIDELDLTAYVLGELDATAHAEVEQRLANDPAARMQVEEIRATADVITVELRQESTPGLGDLHHAAIEQRLAEMEPRAIPLRQRNWAMWGSLAASIVIVCTVMANVLPRIYRVGKLQVNGTDVSGPTSPGAEQDFQPIRPMVLPSQPAVVFQPGERPDFISISHAPPPINHGETGFLRVTDAPLSTVPACSAFPDSADGGTLTRLAKTLAAHHMPPADAVRTDQIINSLAYAYPAPPAGEFVRVNLEVAGCPWEPTHRLVRVGLRVADRAPMTQPATAPEIAGAVGVRIGVEFNPAVAGAYRLIGYEQEGETGGEIRYEAEPSSRISQPEDILGPGRSVTILYEVVPAAGVLDAVSPLGVAGLKYQKLAPISAHAEELVNVTVDYRPVNGLQVMWRRAQASAVDDSRVFAAASDDFRTAAAAAVFGLILRDSPFKGTASIEQLLTIVKPLAADPASPRKSLLELIALVHLVR